MRVEPERGHRVSTSAQDPAGMDDHRREDASLCASHFILFHFLI